MLRRFHADSRYLEKYHLKSIFCLAAVNCGLVAYTQPDWKQALLYLPAILLLTSTNLTTVFLAFAVAAAATFYQPQASYAFLWAVPVMFVMTFPLTSLLHIVAHSVLRPRWLNRVAGEFVGLIQLSGFPDWTVIHALHHAYPDDSERDPHPPVGKTYWEYAKGMRASVLNAFVKYYFKKFGQTPESMAAIKRFALVMKVDVLLRVCFWYLLLGGPLFTSLFAFSIVFKMLHYAWFNYVTHKEDGIHNLNTPLFKVLNFLTYGLYCHGNHHSSPHLADPRTKFSEAETPPAVKIRVQQAS